MGNSHAASRGKKKGAGGGDAAFSEDERAALLRLFR